MTIAAERALPGFTLAAVVDGQLVGALELGRRLHGHSAGAACGECELRGASALADAAERRLELARARRQARSRYLEHVNGGKGRIA